jgi:hypothetical protein
MASVDIRVEQFKTDLRELGSARTVQRHIIFGSAFVLADDQHFGLKEVVARQFQVNPVEVVLVGSAKLGFSIADKKRYRPFGESSDIDLAIISPRLFDSIWDDVFDHYCSVRHWPEEQQFKSYLFRGWIRPDKLPRLQRAEAWWDFFTSITQTGRFGQYKIRAGLYRTMKFLESYQCICAEQCLAELPTTDKANVELVHP